MGQIVFNGQKPKYCNLTAITTGSKKDYLIPDGEIWLIDSTNTSKTDGTGKYDYYIKGDGSNTASQLAANKIKVDDSIDISGKADKSEMSVVAGTGANADKTTITLKSGTSATVLTQHQDVSEFLREGEVFGTGDDSAASFNSYADTVWNKQQTLSESQKQQVRENIGIADLETIRNGAAAGATAIQSVTVGTTTTGAAGSSASVVNSGTATAPVLDFTIPQGAQGVKGDTVIMGNEDTYTLYNTTGDAVDGAMTQQAVTRELAELGGKLALGAVYDVSAENPTAGPNSDGKWETLSTLLSDANLNTLIPTALRKGGMSIKFIQSSDNKYVQFRYMGTSTAAADFINVVNWQSEIVDHVPTLGSKNIAGSGGVARELFKTNRKIDNQPSICPSYNNADLDLGDENGNILVRFSGGNVKTKNFDSSTTPKETDSYKGDFELSDENRNIILRLIGGHIKTKNFDSRQNHTVHFSIDDGYRCIANLYSGNYTSVWDCPFFAAMKTMHENYSAVVTINLFISAFPLITNTYASEFYAAADWLKWTLHGDENQNYGAEGGQYPGGRTQGGQDWSDMVNVIATKLAGNSYAIDQHTRLSNFAGTAANILAMRNQKIGALCFSTSDDNRLSYDEDTNERRKVWNECFYYSPVTNLFFVRSYTRFDSMTMDSSALQNIKVYIEKRKFSEFFIHEQSLVNADGTLIASGINKLRTFFYFIKESGYSFGFFNDFKI